MGAAYGDALGAGVEFYSPEKILQKAGQWPIRSYISGGLGFTAGDITDDTDQALLMAEALIENNDLIERNDPDQYEAFREAFGNKLVAWRRTANDVGGQTSQGISAFAQGKQMDPLSTRPSNGAVMRVYPIAIRFYLDPVKLVNFTKIATAITHPHPDSVGSALLLNGILAYIFNNKRVAGITKRSAVVNGIKEIVPLAAASGTEVPEMLLASIMTLSQPAESTIRAVDCLQLAIANFLGYETAYDIVSFTASFGGDNDTHAAVAGALAGAWFGLDSFPKHWGAELKQYDQVLETAKRISGVE